MSVRTTWHTHGLDPDQRDAAFFVEEGGHTLLVTVSNGERTVQVFVDGEMRIAVYADEESARAGGETGFLGIARHADDLASFGITTDSELADERLVWSMNAWFDLYDEDGTHLDRVRHDIGEALDEAQLEVLVPAKI